MGNRVILFTLLLLTASCWSQVIFRTIISSATLNWGNVQRYCRQSFTSMVTWEGISALSRFDKLKTQNRTTVWVGLRRNTANDSQWNWINQTEDVSRLIRWDWHQSSPHCAYVKGKWFSGRCSKHYQFFCSKGTKVTFHSFFLSWYKAQEFCQEMGGHLVTVTEHNMGDLNQSGWIGLYRVGGDTWRWVGNEPSEYRRWADGQPFTRDCGLFNTATNKYESSHCSKAHTTACHHDNLVLVKLNRTWEEALEFCSHSCTGACRSHLLRVGHVYMHHYVRRRIHEATTDQVWTSRRFLGGRWFWDIGGQPGVSSQCSAHHCGVVSKSDPSMWLSRDCTERRNFICSQFLMSTSLQ